MNAPPPDRRGQSTRARAPWEALPAELIDTFAPSFPAVAEEIIRAIGREVPAYAQPLEGRFGENLRGGVEQALVQFGELVRNPSTGRDPGREIYVALGRGELRSGRSIGALLAAYRVGARVAWRRFAAAGVAAEVSQETLNLLAESIFAYIDELSAESAEGYAQEQAAHAGEVDKRRDALIALLARGAPPTEIADAADAAAWRVPDRLLAVVWREDAGRRPLPQMPSSTIVTELDGAVCAVVPDPDGPRRRAALTASLAETRAGIGSAGPASALPQSLRHAHAALRLAEERGSEHGLCADDHRAELICRADRALVAAVAEDRLAPLDDETPHSRERLRATLLAWLRNDGSVSAAAADLHVHQQTVRYRLARLRELLGGDLDDPDARFELEVALRAAA